MPGLSRFIAITLLALACGAPDPMLLPIRGGATLGSLENSTRPTVLLVYDPADCFRCYAPLASWLQWGLTHPDQFRLVFTRQPTAVEAQQLRLLRVQPHAVLVGEASDHGIDAPAELVLMDGRIIHRQKIASAIVRTDLLVRLTTGVEGNLQAAVADLSEGGKNAQV